MSDKMPERAGHQSNSIDMNDLNDDEEFLDLIAKQIKRPNEDNKDRINDPDTQGINFRSIPKVCHNFPFLKGCNTILVHSNQKRNGLIAHLHGVRIVFNDSISPAHYVLADTICALYISLKYHALNPDYIYDRVAELRDRYQISLLIVMMDYDIYESLLKELTKMAIRANFILLLAWTDDEAAKHIENYRLSSDKSPDSIMGRDFDETMTKSVIQQSLIDALTSVKGINRTDAVTLLSTFETLEAMANVTTDELTICSNISTNKAKKLSVIFKRPFIRQKLIN